MPKVFRSQLAVNSSGKVYGKKKSVGYVNVYIDGAYKTVKVTVK